MTKRAFLIALALLVHADKSYAQRALPPGEVRANGDIVFGGVLKLGSKIGTKVTLTPDALQLSGTGSTGDISTMSVTPDAAAAANSIAKQFANFTATFNAKADLASPTFTGAPAAPTAAAGTNTTQIATTAFVAALGALKANTASPTFTGTPAAPTAAAGTNTTQIATTGFVAALGALKADLASPTFTGTPTAPTAAAGTNTAQIATTGFVAALGALKANLNTANTFTARQVDEYADPARLIKNTSGSTGAFIGDTFNVTQIGRYNPLASAANGIAANTFKSVLGIGDDGKVGSLTNNFGGPLYRNILDDGTGKSQFSALLQFTGANTYTPGPLFYSGYNLSSEVSAGRTGQENITAFAPSWAMRYNGGPDFGNTTPVAAQSLVRCTTASDYKVYESCVNIDFYSRTGYVAKWRPSTAYAVGAKVVNGYDVFVATQAGTSAASGGPSGSGTGIVDGTVRWSYDGNHFTSAKSAWSLGAIAFAGSGKVWGMNPNLMLMDGFRDEAYAMEIDQGNFSGYDAELTNAQYPGVEGIWLGGLYQNTGLSGISVGGFPNEQNKPMYQIGFWCKNAKAAGFSCYEDWSNAAYGFHTSSFATKTFDIWLQATSQVGLRLNGTYSTAQIQGNNFTVNPSGYINSTGMRVTAANNAVFESWYNSGGTANQRTFTWLGNGSNLYLQAYNDAGAFVANLFRVDSSTGNIFATYNFDAATYSAGGTAGATCNAAPTANFRVKNGIVTAC